MKRLRVNTSWEEDAEEKRLFFSNLSYSERLRYYFKLRNIVNFNKVLYPKGKILKVVTSIPRDWVL
jgi:hypothetical protein